MRAFVSQHKLLTICLSAFLLMAATLSVLFFYDSAPPNDRALIPEPTPVIAQQDNAAVVLRGLGSNLRFAKGHLPELNDIPEDDWSQFIASGNGSPKMRALLLERNRKVITLLHAAAAKPNLYFGGYFSNMPDYSPESAMAVEVFEGTPVLFRVLYRDDAGQFRQDAWDDMFSMLSLTRRLKHAYEYGYQSLKSGMFVESSLLKIIANATNTTSDRNTCIGISKRLSPETDVHTVFQNLQMHNYVSLCASFGLGQKPWYLRYYLKPNITKHRLSELILEAIECSKRHEPKIDGPYMQMASSARTNLHTYGFSQYITPNAYGTRIYLFSSSRIRDTYRDLLSRQAWTDTIRCAFAARAYWLDHGTLPESLDALVPEYLPAVPLDAFGNKPLQYNKETCLIYSAGKDLLYDDGAFAFQADATPEGSRPFTILEWARADPRP